MSLRSDPRHTITWHIYENGHNETYTRDHLRKRNEACTARSVKLVLHKALQIRMRKLCEAKWAEQDDRALGLRPALLNCCSCKNSIARDVHALYIRFNDVWIASWTLIIIIRDWDLSTMLKWVTLGFLCFPDLSTVTMNWYDTDQDVVRYFSVGHSRWVNKALREIMAKTNLVVTVQDDQITATAYREHAPLKC